MLIQKKAHGHEHDIQSLIRTCATADIPFALNRATANSLIKSEIVKYEKIKIEENLEFCNEIIGVFW